MAAHGSKGYISSIDQGTSSTRFLIFDSSNGEMVASHQVDNTQFNPQTGWCEHDPTDILRQVTECVDRVVADCRTNGIDLSLLKGVGITNQRETTVMWDKTTGLPLFRAIVWHDARTSDIVDELVASLPNENANHFQERAGLPIKNYFSAVKIRWLMQNVPEVKAACDAGRAMFGNIDSWLIWHLTGGVNGGVHVTDVTNASRTLLMNIKTLQWDAELCDFFGVPMNVLPEIRSSAEVYGKLTSTALKGLPIAGCLGDQQAALVGQLCFHKGEAKNTYGSGCFLLYNTGETPILSRHNLLTTVAYKLGPNAPAVYALEGSVAMAGLAIGWLRNNLGLIASSGDVETMATSVPDTAGVYFVPAFTGLFAPHWRSDARGIIVGLTQSTTKAHVVRATVEAVCFQTREILDAMALDCGASFRRLKVDGGMTINNFLMRQQANTLGIDVVRPSMAETTALGAAIAAGIATDSFHLETFANTARVETFSPDSVSGTHEAREHRYAHWRAAVSRSLGWAPHNHGTAPEPLYEHPPASACSLPCSSAGVSGVLGLAVAFVFGVVIGRAVLGR
eukprot:Opistho-2@57304